MGLKNKGGRPMTAIGKANRELAKEFDMQLRQIERYKLYRIKGKLTRKVMMNEMRRNASKW